MPSAYRGRIAPSPTGYLHLGHARTFWTAFARARENDGALIYREEDLDRARCRPEFSRAAIDDLRKLGIDWSEGPDIGGSYAPYKQSERQTIYRSAWQRLQATGRIYPSAHSRKDVERALSAPHLEDQAEPIFPPALRPAAGVGADSAEPGEVNWRFRVPDGEAIEFVDRRMGPQSYVCLKDFGDFLVWRKDGFPSYEFAVVVDDAAMQISEVVRGEDLLLSTARQLLLYRALQWQPPQFYHCPLMRDENGERLAKRHQALSIRRLFEAGHSAEEIRRMF